MFKMLRLLYDSNCSWETDYIQEIFSEYKYMFTPLKNEDFLNPKKYKNYSNIIVIFSVNIIHYNIMKQFLMELRPLGIVILSDEYGCLNHFNDLSIYSKFTLRNYYYKNYNVYENVHYFPLGYTFGCFDSYSTNLNIIPSSERRYKWSFIGDIKNNERYEMVEKMKSIDNHYIDNKMTTFDMTKIYMNSCFAPNGKGNMNMDCFRLYEASICGCIPVIINKNYDTWDKMNNPPWIFVQDWDEAVIVCNKLYNNKEELNKLQKDILDWWKKNMNILKETLKKYIK